MSRNLRTFRHVGALLLLLFAFGSVGLFTYQSVRNFNRPDGNDLTVYLNASDEFYHDINPYQHTIRRYIYPLFLTSVLYPLALVAQSAFGKALVSGLWAVLSFLVFFLTIASIRRRLSTGSPVLRDIQERLLFYALMIIGLYPFLQDEFLNGQINLFVVGLVGVFFVLLESGKQKSAALVLSIATAIKLAPAVFVLYALAQKRFRTVLYVTALTPALIFGVPALVSSHVLEFYTYYFHTVTATLTAKEASFGYRSFSALSTITHALSVTLPPLVRIGLSGALTLALALPAFVYATHRATSTWRRVVMLALSASIIPLVFPMSESHHLLILTFPMIVIAFYLEDMLRSGVSLLRDGVTTVFLPAFVTLHIGQAFKETPLRFFGVLGIYFGLALLLRKLYFAHDSNSDASANKQ